jgi:perosamine synthetase
MADRIPVSKPDISALEKRYLNQALDSGWISSSGTFVSTFEEKWAEETDSKYALAVSNGTVALHLALVALNIGPGDEVIVPSLTFIATANAIRYVGATPIFCDVEISTWNIDPTEVENLITSRTKAIICVHLYGNPCDVIEIKSLCVKHSLKLVEDAAEAPFAEVEGRRVGSFGDISTFSFFGNKIISCGEGGAVTTSDPELYAKMKILRDQGMDPNRRYYFTEIGYNYRLTNLQCSLLVAQIERSGEMIEKRNELEKTYKKLLEQNSNVEFQKCLENNLRSPWLFTFTLKSDSRVNSVQLRQYLEGEGIETRPVFIPIHSLPPYSDLPKKPLMKTDSISSRGLSLPTSSTMSVDQAVYISNLVLSKI